MAVIAATICTFEMGRLPEGRRPSCFFGNQWLTSRSREVFFIAVSERPGCVAPQWMQLSMAQMKHWPHQKKCAEFVDIQHAGP
jgi:hypothetical protein